MQVKEGMLLWAANPRKTPPSKAVRKFVLNTFLAVLQNCGTIIDENNKNSSIVDHIFEYQFYSAQTPPLLFVGFWYRLPAMVTVSYVAKQGGQIHDRTGFTCSNRLLTLDEINIPDNNRIYRPFMAKLAGL